METAPIHNTGSGISVSHHDLPINREEALQFIERLCGQSRVTWQTFHDQKTEHKNGRLARVLHDCKQVTLQQLQDFQLAGAGVFCTVNETDGQGRKNENITRVRSLVLDLDGAPLAPVQACTLKPQIIVESSQGRYHCYWLVDDCPLDQYKPTQQLLARKFSGDPSVCDLARVMRVPGYWHLKDPANPFQTRIIYLDDTPPYQLEHVIAGLGLREDDTDDITETFHESEERNYLWTDPSSGEVFDLRAWTATFRGFKLASALRQCHSKAINGPAIKGKQHIRCVNDDQHTDQTMDNATFVMDAQNSSTGSFVYCCQHAHCQGIDRLTFIRMMLEKGWLTRSDLTSKKFNIITEPKHPAFVKFDADAVFGTLQLLSPPHVKNLLMLGAASMRKCHGGVLPDDNLIISMMLGITEQEWSEVKTTLLRLNIISTANKSLYINHFYEIYQEAAESYIKAAISGSKGGNANHPLST